MPKDPKPAVADLFSWDDRSGRQSGGWSNKLIWGDNKLLLAALKNGPLRKEIEDAGGLKLAYIDPPFDVGADFSFNIQVGGEGLTKHPTIIEEIAYRDPWGRGADSYLTMMFERLLLMKEVLNEKGSIYVHCDWRMASLLRQVLDEIFGNENFQREVIWAFDTKSGYKTVAKNWIRSHDTILFFNKSRDKIFKQTIYSLFRGISA